PPRIRVNDEDGIRIVRFVDRQLFDEPTVRVVAEQLFAALPRSGPIALILDLSGVDLVSSSMLGKLILLQRRADSSGGMLRLCDLTEGVLGVLRTTNLDRLFAIDHDLAEAKEAFRAPRRS
ncbi:MAG: STAS domain-containing protein, partial [Isosphaeraceae bacterium]|nr:STAS domain-containing protein [Isosphaeraceae bacterium]